MIDYNSFIKNSNNLFAVGESSGSLSDD